MCKWALGIVVSKSILGSLIREACFCLLRRSRLENDAARLMSERRRRIDDIVAVRHGRSSWRLPAYTRLTQKHQRQSNPSEFYADMFRGSSREGLRLPQPVASIS
jgi:hypothetical protein